MAKKTYLILFVLLIDAFVFFSTSKAQGPAVPAAAGATPAAPAAAGAAPAGAGAAPAAAGAAPAAAGGAPAAAGGAPAGAPGAAAGAPGAAAGPGGPPGAPIDITTLGAKPGCDATPAMLKAWEQACACTTPSTIKVPPGNFSLGILYLSGPCKAPITIDICGNFDSPKTVAEFKGNDTWVMIQRVAGLTIKGNPGGGVFNGNGADAWKMKNAAGGTLPYNFRLFYVNDSTITGITSLDSKQFHMNVISCYNLTIQSIKIIAPGDSHNTDGIHLGRCTGVKISDVEIQTGDDCISVGDGTRNLTVEKVTCGPGHGFSVGSLGRYDNEENVEGIFASNCTFKSTDNGVRIKSWLNSKPCCASEMHFTDMIMDNVTFPILIDQAYCPSASCDASVPSKVKISNVFFKNIQGTARDPSVMRFVCSTGVPCENVNLENINITYSGPLGAAVSECCNVKPVITGNVCPAACAKATTEADAAKHITASGASGPAAAGPATTATS